MLPGLPSDSNSPRTRPLRVIRQHRLRYLGHIIRTHARMPESRVVRRALEALAEGGTVYSKDSLFMECQAMEMDHREMDQLLVALAQRRGAWNALAKQLHWDGLPLYHWTPWVWDGIHR